MWRLMKEIHMEYTLGKVIFTGTLSYECIDQQNEFKSFLKYYRMQIIQAIEDDNPNLKGEIDSSYEGGIDSWFGPGSVGVCELAMAFRVTHRETGITLELIQDTYTA